MDPVTVRTRLDEDLPGAVAALVEVHRTDGYPVEGVDAPEAWLRSGDVLAAWVAEAGRRVVGHVAIMRGGGAAAVEQWIGRSGEDRSGVAVLARLFVVEGARKQATGRRLVEAATAWGHARGLRLVLDVVAKDVAAMRLYERLGWRRIGEVAHHYGVGRTTPATCYVAPAGPVCGALPGPVT
ncbi:GNAT family N-acetyltransferase [Streptomyces sp. NPDC059740]|uniref:GNAT family N-acetyltransferase n=1 Tax=Streptomyces sp. NPDC059740 TaxID=3346926 RepID=UPI003667B0B1